MKFLSDEQLKQAAEELGVDEKVVRSAYERSITSGNPFANMKALKEAVEPEDGGTSEKEDGGGANSTQKNPLPPKKKPKKGEEGYEEDEEEMSSEKEELSGTIAGMTDEEFKDLADTINTERNSRNSVANIVSDLSEDEFKQLTETVDSEQSRRGVETATKEQLMEIIARQQEQSEATQIQMKALTEAFTGLTGVLTQSKEAGAGKGASEAVAEFLSQVPRQQASSFVSHQEKEEGEENSGLKIEDGAIMTQIKQAVQEAMKESQHSPNDVYSLFTSKELNREVN